MPNNYFFNSFNHYYGDAVRILFLAGALIMLIGLPAVTNYLSIPAVFSVVGMLVLVLAAGLTSPKQIWDAGINVVISVIAFVVFETYAVNAYSERGMNDKFFVANMALGLIFLFAIYFGVKTFRGLMLAKKNN